MTDKKTLLVIYDHGRIEHFNPDEAEYWIQRRLDKEGLVPTEAWLAEPFDFDPIVDAYYAKLRAAETQSSEARERREYERLRKKFETLRE